MNDVEVTLVVCSTKPYRWRVSSNSGALDFNSVEEASEALMAVGVPDHEVDNALIEMFNMKHVRARFTIENATTDARIGRFTSTDDGS